MNVNVSSLTLIRTANSLSPQKTPNEKKPAQAIFAVAYSYFPAIINDCGATL